MREVGKVRKVRGEYGMGSEMLGKFPTSYHPLPYPHPIPPFPHLKYLVSVICADPSQRDPVGIENL